MNCNDINTKLDVLYSSVWCNLKSELCELNSKETGKKCASLPLFIQLGEDYDKADLKIMYFGQEERPISKFTEEVTLSKLYDYYKENNDKKNHEPQSQGSGGEMSDFLKKIFGVNTTYTIHNNVIKIPSCNDDVYGKATKEIKGILRKDYFNKLILNEIKIIKPDAIFIFPRVYYKNRLVKQFIGDIKEDSRQSKPFSEIMPKMNISNPKEFWKQLICGYFESVQDVPDIQDIPVIIAKHPSHGHLNKIKKYI